MSRPTAIIEAVNRTTSGDAQLRLDVISGKCPRWLVLRRPPQHFDAIVGTQIEVTFSGVYVNGELWAKRQPKDCHEIVLIARRKA